ncbi:hypothetical protein EDD15DRAFT_2362441 [Pisolithus albus]|nr:hypothetical protein EDD15DRAFT_2362441 [Pisolithus albus]
MVDIVCDHGDYYEVRDYSPYDPLAVVMSAKIEVYCIFRQYATASGPWIMSSSSETRWNV